MGESDPNIGSMRENGGQQLKTAPAPASNGYRGLTEPTYQTGGAADG